MNFKMRESIKPELNMTQLIDVVLLLLIFFMISSSFVVQPGLKINLPQATTQDLQPENRFKLIITARNQLFLDNQSIELTQLKSALEQKTSAGNNRFLLIKADRKVEHGLVVRVMDIARSLNFEVGIATQTGVADD